jgi:CO dehydrogenase/acetyl-CoA synthase alpha subunit
VLVELVEDVVVEDVVVVELVDDVELVDVVEVVEVVVVAAMTAINGERATACSVPSLTHVLSFASQFTTCSACSTATITSITWLEATRKKSKFCCNPMA